MQCFETTLPHGTLLDLTEVQVASVTVVRATKRGVTVRVVPLDPQAVLRARGRPVGGKLRLTVLDRALTLGAET